MRDRRLGSSASSTADGETFCVSSPGVGVLFGVLVTESVISKPAGRLRRKLLSLPALLALIVRIALSTIRRIPAPRPTARPGPLARR